MTIKAKKISTIICSLIILLSLYVTPVSGLLIKKLVLTAIHMVQIKWNSGPLQL